MDRVNRHSVASVNEAMERVRLDRKSSNDSNHSLGGESTSRSGGSGIGVAPTSGNNGTVKRASSMSSNYSNINASLHARVKAFQEQRGLHRSSSLGKGDSEENIGNVGTSINPSPSLGSMKDEPVPAIQKIVNKPLPPLPGQNSSSLTPSQETINMISNASQQAPDGPLNNISPVPGFKEAMGGNVRRNDGQNPYGSTSPAVTASAPNMPAFNPNRKAPRPPQIPHNTVIPAKPMQSLSSRRGLKLPPGGMKLKLPSKGDAPASMPSTVPAASSVKPVVHQEFAATPSNKNHIKNNNGSTEGKRSNPGSLVNAVQTTSISSANDQQDTEGTEPKSNSNGTGLFANFSRYVDIKSGSLNFAGKLSLSSRGIDFSNGSSSRITLDELQFIEELGHGNYGTVSKVLHKPNNVLMAMKEVRLELDESKFRQILMELEVLHKCNSPFIVDFYGAFFIEGAVYMCMEYMDGGSLDKIYDENPEMGGIDEPQLAFITNAVIQGLRELKEVHNVIHRDLKPTNILCSAKQGTVKLCDFGVSGNLVASLAKTNIGCQSYMAPERIKSLNPDRGTYTVQSDIWSLGLSILEMALGRYPYPPETFDNIFSQLSAIVDGPPPKLPADKFSDEAQDFVSLCLQKIPDRRPNYSNLYEHPWLAKYRSIDVQMGPYITKRLEIRKRILAEKGEDGLHRTVPALHKGGL